MHSWSKLLVISAVLFLLLQVSIPWVSAANEDTITLGLNEAEETLASAYEAVLEAEQSGANVSGMLIRLNLAGSYLAEAQVWYRLGVSENASHFAGLCSEVVGDMGNEAVELRNDAKRLWEVDFVVKITLSVGGVIVVVVVCTVIWHVFKRRYRKRALGFRVNLNSNFLYFCSIKRFLIDLFILS